MAVQTMPCDELAQIILTVHGNLQMSGHDRPEIKAETPEGDDLQLRAANGQIHLESRSNCQIKVPRTVSVRAEVVDGNATFQSITGPIEIFKIGDNLTLRDVAGVEVHKVYGNLRAHQLRGDLRIKAVYGNTSANLVMGQVSIAEAVKGNLVLNQVGSAQATALGNGTLSLDPQPGQNYRLEVSGNIHCKLPPNRDVAVQLASPTRHLRLDVPGHPSLVEAAEHSFTLGEGHTPLTLIAKGYIHLTVQALEGEPDRPLAFDLDYDAASMTSEISHMINRQMESLEQELNERLAHLSELGETSHLGTDIDEIVEQARQYTTRAALRAQKKAEAAAKKAQAKLARKLERARQQAARQGGKGRRPTRVRWSRTDSASGTPAADPVSEEERLLILKMLEEQKISLEEADRLLTVLETEES